MGLGIHIPAHPDIRLLPVGQTEINRVLQPYLVFPKVQAADVVLIDDAIVRGVITAGDSLHDGVVDPGKAFRHDAGHPVQYPAGPGIIAVKALEEAPVALCLTDIGIIGKLHVEVIELLHGETVLSVGVYILAGMVQEPYIDGLVLEGGEPDGLFPLTDRPAVVPSEIYVEPAVHVYYKGRVSLHETVGTAACAAVHLIDDLPDGVAALTAEKTVEIAEQHLTAH